MVGRGGDHDHQPGLRDGHDRGRVGRRCRRTSSGPSTTAASSRSARRACSPGVHARAGRGRVADQRPGGRADHPRAGLRAPLRRAAAYFLDPTGRRVVPDPRHLIRGAAQPTALVQRLLEGPSAALAAGVDNPLGGVQLRSAVTVRGQEATVDLTGLSDRSGAAAVADLRPAGVDADPVADPDRGRARRRRGHRHRGGAGAADRRRLGLPRSRRRPRGRGWATT